MCSAMYGADYYVRRAFREGTEAGPPEDRQEEEGDDGIPDAAGSVLMSVATDRTEDARRILSVVAWCWPLSLFAREVLDEGRLKKLLEGPEDEDGPPPPPLDCGCRSTSMFFGRHCQMPSTC